LQAEARCSSSCSAVSPDSEEKESSSGNFQSSQNGSSEGTLPGGFAGTVDVENLPKVARSIGESAWLLLEVLLPPK
jgi:hypothetical protein